MKMPTTTNNKVEAKLSTDLGDAAKQCLNCLEKKVRNLEKRKGRIEQNQEKAKKGTKLEKEQENSLQQYEQVTHDLEFARELHKQFLQINQEHEKMMKKQAKRDKAERQALEIKRISEILQLQSLLDSLGGDKVREDFKTGKHGAVVLTEDNLNQLDKLYQAISPSRDDSGDEYPQRLTLAAEHLVNVLDGKDRQVVGTTYKELKVLITLINECGYFERAQQAKEVAVVEPSQDTEHFENSTEEPTSSELLTSSEQDQTTDQQQQQPIDLTIGTTDGVRSKQELPTQPLSTLEQDAFFAPSNTPYRAESEPQYSQLTHTAPRIPDFQSFTNNRPFQFIQASYVMPESTAPGINDPAVIVAQPAGGSSLQFMSQGFDNGPQVTSQPPSQQQQTQSVSTVSDLNQQPQLSVSQQSQQPQQITQEYSSQAYSQSSLQQNIQTEGLFSVQAVTEVSNVHSGIIGQIREDNVSSYEIPPSIPMPPSQSQQDQTLEQQQLAQEKKFPMNAATPVAPTQPSVPSLAETQAPPPSADFSSTPTPSGDFGQPISGEFQQAYQTNNGFTTGAYPRGGRGGFRGSRGGNGGNGGNRNGGPNGSPVQNGFNGRGGSANTNNSRGGRGIRGGIPRGGGATVSRGTSRGGYNRTMTAQ
uniref:Caprin-1 dimerization domain-containing protein n=1 Tax=Arion vulgaris TaxID=1028688 RepID=A0A0B6ZBB6_9EUPU